MAMEIYVIFYYRSGTDTHKIYLITIAITLCLTLPLFHAASLAATMVLPPGSDFNTRMKERI